MITNNMGSNAFLQHVQQDVPVMLFDLTAKDRSKLLYRDAATARAALETEGVEGSVIHWEYMPLLRRYEIVWVPML